MANIRALNLMIGLGIAACFALASILPSIPATLIQFAIAFTIPWLGFELGQRIPSPHRAPIIRSILGISVFLAGIALLQTGAYYLGILLGNTIDLVVLAIVTAKLSFLLYFLPPHSVEPLENLPVGNPRTAWIIPIALGLGGLGICISLLWITSHSGTAHALRTPWPLLPTLYLPFLAILWVGVFGAAIRTSRSAVLVGMTALALISLTALTPLLYQSGFGFDGFLHQASERVLAETGTLHPKPLYYIGQYTIVTWLARLTDLPIHFIDIWLVPILSAILLPTAFALRSKTSRFSLWALALLPLSPFIATTPQSLAYVLGLSALLIKHELIALPLLAWCLAVHPLAGLPLMGLYGAYWFAERSANTTPQRILNGFGTGFSILFACVGVPLAFFWIGGSSNTAIIWKNWDWSTWFSSLSQLFPSLTNRFLFWPLWSEWVATGSLALLFVIACVTAWRDAEHRKIALTGIFASLGLCLAGTFLTIAGDFQFLIDYERDNYADRLFLIAAFALVPAVRFACARFVIRLQQEGPWLLTGTCVLFGLLAGGQAYAALPRHDALTIGRGWSVGAADLEAVQWIDQDAGSKPYAVLANQSVSAAAVSKLGFKRYVNDVFFYPIPTGGPLYEQYLRLVYREQTRDPILEAARLTQSRTVYVIINDYWFRAEILREALGAIADDRKEIGTPNGPLGTNLTIFTFHLPEPDPSTSPTVPHRP